MGVSYAGAATWRYLRMLRADLPGQAGSAAHRKRTFWAALEQGEQLWTAADAVTASARPLPLFYGLLQAALALSAARSPGREWEFKKGHGLDFDCPNVKDDKPPTLDHATVKPHGAAGINKVASLLGSPALTSEASLHALACSLPQSERFLLEDVYPGPLFAGLVMTEHHPFATTDEVLLTVGPLPDDLVDGQDNPLSAEVVEGWLKGYPTLAAAVGSPAEVVRIQSDLAVLTGGEHRSNVVVRLRLAAPMTGNERLEYVRRLVDVPDPNVGEGVTGTVLPAVGGNSAPMHPLIAWWVLLYGFSMWARYHPRSWVSLLDPDTSPLAVPVELILDEAAEAVPRILLKELLEQPETDDGQEA